MCCPDLKTIVENQFHESILQQRYLLDAAAKTKAIYPAIRRL